MSSDTVYQQLREHLHYLGLRAAADTLAPALQTAEKTKPGYTQFLHDLLATEVQAAEQRRLQGRLRFAKLPARKTLEQFDFDWRRVIRSEYGTTFGLVSMILALFVLEKVHWHGLEAALVRVRVAAALWLLSAGLWASARWAKKAGWMKSPG